MTFSEHATRWVKDIQRIDVGEAKARKACRISCAKEYNTNRLLTPMEYAPAAPDLVANSRFLGDFTSDADTLTATQDIYNTGTVRRPGCDKPKQPISSPSVFLHSICKTKTSTASTVCLPEYFSAFLCCACALGRADLSAFLRLFSRGNLCGSERLNGRCG
jgi:hypothetical protein